MVKIKIYLEEEDESSLAQKIVGAITEACKPVIPEISIGRTPIFEQSSKRFEVPPGWATNAVLTVLNEAGGRPLYAYEIENAIREHPEFAEIAGAYSRGGLARAAAFVAIHDNNNRIAVDKSEGMGYYKYKLKEEVSASFSDKGGSESN